MRKVVFDVPHTYRGETHTLMEWSKILGINYNTLCARVRRGLKGDDVFKPLKPNYKGRIAKTYEIEGHKGTLHELAEIYGICYNTVIARLQCGYSLAKALKTTPIKGGKHDPYWNRSR